MFEDDTTQKQDADTLEAMSHPKTGDRFHETYSFWVYVIAVNESEVVTMEASPPCEFPKDGKVKKQTKEEFYNRFAYSHNNQKFWVTLAGRGKNVAGWHTA